MAKDEANDSNTSGNFGGSVCLRLLFRVQVEPNGTEELEQAMQGSDPKVLCVRHGKDT